jgi:hypothetical protein
MNRDPHLTLIALALAHCLGTRPARGEDFRVGYLDLRRDSPHF